METKKPSGFAMSDDDEFIETGENEEGAGDEGSEGSSEEGDASDSDGSEGDSSSGADDDGVDSGESAESDQGGESEGSGEDGQEGDSEGDGEGEGSEGEGSESGEEGQGSEGEEESESEGSSEGEEGSGSEESGEESGFFDDLGDEGEEESGEQSTSLSFKKIGSVLDIEIEADTEEEFTTKVKEKIEGAKQEVNLEKFDPEARRLVKHLNENEGKIGDFFVNPKITRLQNVLTLKAEDKVRMVRRGELSKDGGTAEEIEQEIGEELSSMSAQDIVNVANKIDTDAKKLIAEEIEGIVGESEQRTKEKEQQSTEREQERRKVLKNHVQKMDNFLGLSLSDKDRQAVSRDIDSGRFDQIVDLTDEDVQLAAYMIKRAGGKISERFSKQLAEKGREGYNKAIDKTKGKLHKTKTEGQSTRTGHQESSQGKKNFDTWGEMNL